MSAAATPELMPATLPSLGLKIVAPYLREKKLMERTKTLNLPSVVMCGGEQEREKEKEVFRFTPEAKNVGAELPSIHPSISHHI